MSLLVEWFRVLALLIYKNWLARDRQWKSCLIGEVLLPVGLLSLIWYVRNAIAEPPVRVNEDTYHEEESSYALIRTMIDQSNENLIFYAPKTNFTATLMNDVNTSCFYGRTTLRGFKTEAELLSDYHDRFVSHESHKPPSVIFDESSTLNTSKHLNYKIRSRYLLDLMPHNIFAIVDVRKYFTETNFFVQMQLCIDESFIRLKGSRFILDTFVQQVPLPPHTKANPFDKIFREFFGILFTTVFMMPQIMEASRIMNEKSLGVNVLMSMNGVSSTLHLLGWLANAVIFIGIFCMLPITLLLQYSITDNAMPYVHYSNANIVFLVFILFAAQTVAFGIHVSSYITNSLLLELVLLFIHMAIPTVYNYIITDESIYLVPYFGILFPDLLLLRAFQEINHYELNGEGVHWDNIFDVADAKYREAGSVGGVLLCSTMGTIIHFILAVYIYEINPGKYGAPKHPLYFLMIRISKANTNNTMDNLELGSTDTKYFEPDNGANYEPGIQMRGLKKTYSLGFLGKTKVNALKGVSVDFYKGQITALLGQNGAGKTTMISILTGMQTSTEGTVLINSKNIKLHSRQIMNDMGLCTQENMLFPNLSVGEQLKFFALLKGKGKSLGTIQRNVASLLSKLKLEEKKDTLPKQLSGGQKRRVCLGMALVGDSNTLILDEPTSGLDPENRRIIWDVLLKMRGKKTILISTHDMEEADVLGDRIAILHNGELRSYGTSMYLKKSIGRNSVLVTLSVKASGDPKVIRSALNGRVENISQDGSRMVVSIPYSSDLPDYLDKLDSRKNELGISGFSASLMSIEQVFLQVIKEDDDTSSSRESFFDVPNKWTGILLVIQMTGALLCKKMTYTLKNLLTIIYQLVWISIMLLIISVVMKGSNISGMTSKLIPISLDMYHKPITYFQTSDENFGKQYAHITQQFGGRSVQVQHWSLTETLLNYAKSDLAQYNNHLIAATDFFADEPQIFAIAFYSDHASYSFPISVNLMMNALAKAHLGDDYSISVSSQRLPSLDDQVYQDESTSKAFIIALIVTLCSCLAMSFFVIHPLQESRSSVKQLQTMAGVSCFTYWATMFLLDMLLALMLIAATLFGFNCMDSELDLGIFMYDGMRIYCQLYLLFAISSLPLLYVASFLDKEPTKLIENLTYKAFGLIIVELVMYGTSKTNFGRNAIFLKVRPVQRVLFLLVPFVSFFHGQVAYYETALINARCAKIPNEFYDVKCTWFDGDKCCYYDCRDGKCMRHMDYFDDLNSVFNSDFNLQESFDYLAIASFLYFGILIVLEFQWIQMLRAKLKWKVAPVQSSDEQVEQSKAAIAKRINSFRDKRAKNTASNDGGEGSSTHDSQVQFMVYELSKSYGRVKAVKDVSFDVLKKQCFGLLGVNGAGKSTTFRMMTGAEVPDSGIMYMGDKNFKRHKRYFLSQMGYCPQHDALIMSLNAYDHLRLFARLRGIPVNKVQREVETWIHRLDLTACASRRSETYSGGNKRRLNIAITLIGIPNVVLLDEPTTGVDPGARHSLWNVIQICQMTGQAVVLTSHSMDECENLCNRLAIMVDGRLVCIGTSPELRQRFGAGYDIKIKLNPEKSAEQLDAIKADMEQALECEIADENVSHLMYHVAASGTSWRKMYNLMNAMKSRYDCIDDFSVVSSTLERLFLLFARAAN